MGVSDVAEWKTIRRHAKWMEDGATRKGGYDGSVVA